MKPKITEPQALLLLILFIAFATIMLSRAHGAGGLGNGIVADEVKYEASCRKTRDIEKKWSIQTIFGGCFVNDVRVSDDEKDKEFAEDLAAALNEAHSKRLRPLRTRTTGMTGYPCCEDNAQAPVCYVCESK